MYRADNRAEIAAKRDEWEVANRERRKIAHKQWATLPNVRERRNAKQREWNRSNQPTRRDQRQRRRARLRGSISVSVTVAEIWRRDRGRCGICAQPLTLQDVSIDHILPISCGGTHEPRNVRVTHLKCNIARQHRGAAQMRLFS
jgi:5-methylcytosine-specific restriction endonuclease McrA